MALEITDANFEELVLKSDKPVLVDFWATWCGPCRMVGPIVDELANDYEGKARIGRTVSRGNHISKHWIAILSRKGCKESTGGQRSRDSYL